MAEFTDLDFASDLPDFSAEELYGEPASPGPAVDPDPIGRFQRLINQSKDAFTLDFEPLSDADPEYANVFGKAMDRGAIERTKYGKPLLAVIKANRQGRRGFGEAITDVGLKDLPFIGDVAGDAASIRELDRVPGILDALRRGDDVSDDDLVLARYVMAHGERRAQASLGGKVGAIARNLPTFGAEMYAVNVAAKYALKPLGRVAARWGAKQVGVGLGAAATGPGAPVAGAVLETAATAATVVDAALAVPKVAKAARTGWSMSKALTASSNFMREFTARAVTDFTGDAILGVTADAAGKEIALGYFGLARRGLGKLLITAPLRTPAYMGVDMAADVAFNTMTGQSDPTISRSEVENRIAGAVTGNERLRNNAKWLALGDEFIQYMSEMSGDALSDLTFSQAGLFIKRAAGETGPAKKFGELLAAVYPTRASQVKRLGELKAIKDPRMVSALSMRMLDKMIKYNINAEAAWGVMKRAGQDGMIEEMAEERWGGFVGGLFGTNGDDPGLQNAWKQMWPEVDQLKAEAISFAIPAITAIGTGQLGMTKMFGGTGYANFYDTIFKVKEAVGANGNQNATAQIHGDGVADFQEAERLPDGVEEGKLTTELLDSILTLSNTERAVHGPRKHLARAAQSLLRLTRVAVTGNFDELRYSSADRVLAEYGLTTLLRDTANFRDALVDDVLRKRAQEVEAGERPAGGRTVDDLKYLDREEIEKSPEVLDTVRKDVRQILMEHAAHVNGVLGVTAEDIRARAKELGLAPKDVAANVGKYFSAWKKYKEAAEKDPALARKMLEEDSAAGLLTREGTDGRYVYHMNYQGKTAAEVMSDSLRLATARVFAGSGVQNTVRLTNDANEKVDLNVIPGVVIKDPSNVTDDELRTFMAMGRWTTPDRARRRGEARQMIARFGNAAAALTATRPYSIEFRGKQDLAVLRRLPGSPNVYVVASPEVQQGLGRIEFPSTAEAVAAMTAAGLAPQARPLEYHFTTATQYRADNPARFAQLFGDYFGTKVGPVQGTSWAAYWSLYNRVQEDAYADNDAGRGQRDADRTRLKEIDAALDSVMGAWLGRGTNRRNGAYWTSPGAFTSGNQIVLTAPGQIKSFYHGIEDTIESAVEGDFTPGQRHALGIIASFASRLAGQTDAATPEGKTEREELLWWAKFLADGVETYAAEKGGRSKIRETTSKTFMMLTGWMEDGIDVGLGAGRFDINVLGARRLLAELQRDPKGARAAAAFLSDTVLLLTGNTTSLEAIDPALLPPIPAKPTDFNGKAWLSRLDVLRRGLLGPDGVSIDYMSIEEGEDAKARAKKKNPNAAANEQVARAVQEAKGPDAPPPREITAAALTEEEREKALAQLLGEAAGGAEAQAKLSSQALSDFGELPDETIRRLICSQQEK